MASVTLQGNCIAVYGDFTVKTVAEIFRDTVNFDDGNFLVDLENVTECDSAGLAMLVHWYAEVNKSSGSVEFRNVPQKLLEVANLGGLGSLFQAAI